MNRQERRLRARMERRGRWTPPSDVQWRGTREATPPGIMVTLGYSDIYGSLPSHDMLLALIRSCTTENLVWKLSAVGTLLTLRRRSTSLASQQQLAGELLPPDARGRGLDLLSHGERQVLVHHEALVVAAILALAHGQPGTGDAPGDRDPSMLGRLLPMINDLLAEGPREWGLDDALKFALRNDVFGATDQARNVIARYYDLIGIRARAPQAASRMNLDIAFADATGVSLEDYWTLGMAHFGLFAQLRRASDLDAAKYGAVVINPQVQARRVFDRFAALVSRPISEVRRSQYANPPASLAYADIEPFLRAPPISMTSGALVPVWLPWFVDKLGSGPRWMLQDHFGSRSGSGVQDFNAHLGTLWEDYVFDLLARCYPAEGALQVLYAAITYGNPPEESNDATLFLGDAAIFVEATVTAPAARTSWTGDADAYRHFIRDRMVSGRPAKLAKLARRVDDFLSGRLQFPGIDHKKVRHVLPVLATLTPYPRTPITDAVVRQESGELLSQVRQVGAHVVHPVGVLAAEELEIVEAASRAGEMDLGVELRRWTGSEHRGWPFKNYLFSRNLGSSPNPHLQERFAELQELVMKRASELLVLGS